MIYHTKCSGYLLLDVTGGFRVMATVGMSETKLTVNVLDIKTGDSDIPAKFVCPECSESVDIGEVFTRCMECGKRLGISEAFKIRGSSGIYCDEHAKMFAAQYSTPRTIKKFLEIINTVKISR
jgi:hypothetical protein